MYSSSRNGFDLSNLTTPKLVSLIRRFKDKKELEPEADPERDQRTVFAFQMPLKATERDVYEFFSKEGKVCDDCIGERESCELVKKLNYCNEDICVYLVQGKEVPKSIREASGNNPEPERRTSKRSKKSSSGNSVNLAVSGTTSIYQLKMMIWEAFGVVKENQKLHKGSIELDGDSSTLADKNIFPGDVLWVKDSEIHENRDIADELAEQKMSPEKVEEGFRGTLLTSGLSSFEFNDRIP